MGKQSQILSEISLFFQEFGHSAIVVYEGINSGVIGPCFFLLVLWLFFTAEFGTDFPEIF